MAQFECGRRGPVILAPGQPRPQPHPVPVPHRGRWFIAGPPARCGQPPDEVDVLPHLHFFGKTRSGGSFAHDQGGPGDVGNARSRPDDAGPLSHVKGRTRPLVPGQPASPDLVRDDARRDRTYRRVSEVRQQQIQPARAGRAVGVEESDQRGISGGQARVPGCRRPAVNRPPQYAGARPGRDARDGLGVPRAVVDHDQSRRLGQPGQAAGQLGVPVAHRDHDRHLVRAVPAAGRRFVQGGMDDSGVE
jgi:hypothetical protein